MSETIPVIDLGPLLSGGEEGRKAVAAEIGAACRGIGFFYVCNHGVPPELREEVFATAARFFESPEEVKRTALYSAASGNRGFIPMKGESLDPTKAPDLKEAFNIGLEMAEDDPEIVAGARFRGLNLWPEMGGFRQTMLQFVTRQLISGQDLQRYHVLERRVVRCLQGAEEFLRRLRDVRFDGRLRGLRISALECVDAIAMVSHRALPPGIAAVPYRIGHEWAEVGAGTEPEVLDDVQR